MNRVCYTALIGPYEELKNPTVPSPGWEFICFTDQPITSDVWKIVQVPTGEDPQRTARRIKIMFHKYIEAEESMWLDASFQINVDLNWIWHYFKGPFTAPRHPIRHCIYAEIDSCLVNKRGDSAQLAEQRVAYTSAGVPWFTDTIITSGLLMRNRGAIELCCEWWEELSKHSARDQVAFGRIAIGKEWHNFPWDYSQSKQLVYKKHFHLRH